MYHKFTQEEPDEYCNVMDRETTFSSLSPRKDTLTLIMQFAHAYYVEKELPVRMPGIILN